MGLNIPINELVATVDSYQGQERDLIILTFTRSNTQGIVGFLKDWRRLNVAMTRAKRQLIMVGDLSTLTRPNRFSKKPDQPDYFFKKVMQDLEKYVEEKGQFIDATLWLKK